MTFCVGREGVEPSRYFYRRILSPLRLPIPPSPQVFYCKHRLYFTISLLFFIWLQKIIVAANRQEEKKRHGNTPDY